MNLKPTFPHLVTTSNWKGFDMPTLAELDIVIPDTKLAKATLALLNATSPPFLCNHCMRTYAFGALGARRLGKSFDPEIGFVAAALHDLGLLPEFESETQRFELDGADAARKFVEDQGLDPRKADLVWDAVALHSTVGVPLRKEPEVALVHIGAGIDAFGVSLDMFPPEVVEAIIEAYPRLGFKAAFLKIVLDYAKRKPSQQAFTWTSVLAHSHIPGFPCPTVTQAYAAAAFAE